MKVVIFAGGLGTRMREETDFRPKPMVEIGSMPVLWHLMKIYSSQGFDEFVILAGYKAAIIKDFFANMDARTRDFSVDTHTQRIEFLSGSHENWKVSILDTGAETLTGERLLRARDIIGSGSFHCTYGDGLAPVDLSELTATHLAARTIATMTVTRPTNRFGVVEFDEERLVHSFREKPVMNDWVNMGFFIFEHEIFNHLRAGESLEEGALNRLASSGQIGVNQFEGFWEPMDTFREFQLLNRLWDSGGAPWKIWS